VTAKTIVVGLGNSILSDDAVGLRVAAALRPMLADRPDIEVVEDEWGGLRLMERLTGYDQAVIVDAMRTGAPPGTIRKLSPDDLPTLHSASSHDTGLPVALEVGRRAGARLPATEDIILVGIEAQDVTTFAEELTPEVEAAVEAAVQVVLEILEAG
jgi:hydrogenase maturation protease